MMTASNPVFRLLMLSDAHLSAGVDAESSQHKFDRVAELIRRHRARHVIDALLLLGDMVHEASPESRDCLKRKLDAIPVPQLISIPGNHDKSNHGSSPALEETPPCGLLESDGRLQAEAREFKGLVIIMLDNADGDIEPTPAVRERNRSLRRIMNKYRGWPKIALCHVPLVPMREEEALRSSFNYPTWVNRDAELLEIIESEAESVVAVLSGHVHLSGHVVRRGISHVTTSGSLSWPHDIAELACHPERIEVRMLGLAEEHFPGGFNGLPLGNGIHDAHGAEREFTDADHPSFREYVTGNAAERRFTIRLAGQKRIRG